ncbi:hypothetical protein Tco_0290059 [Tanacetum coccineum]
MGDPKSSVQTRSRVQQNLGAHALEEPKNISEALKDDSWVEAMKEELLQFRLQQVWILVDLPHRAKVIGTSGIRAFRGTLTSYHEDASDNGTATNKPKQQQQQLIPTTTTISNIKLLILKKEEYDIWAMEMEHYLEYIDNDVWKVIQNGNSKKRISTRKDGVVRVLPPVSATEIHVVEKERKARTILLMAIPKEHLRRFHGIDDAKEIWGVGGGGEAIRTTVWWYCKFIRRRERERERETPTLRGNSRPLNYHPPHPSSMTPLCEGYFLLM